jgi:hypothetical protein
VVEPVFLSCSLNVDPEHLAVRGGEPEQQETTINGSVNLFSDDIHPERAFYSAAASSP